MNRIVTGRTIHDFMALTPEEREELTVVVPGYYGDSLGWNGGRWWIAHRQLGLIRRAVWDGGGSIGRTSGYREATEEERLAVAMRMFPYVFG